MGAALRVCSCQLPVLELQWGRVGETNKTQSDDTRCWPPKHLQIHTYMMIALCLAPLVLLIDTPMADRLTAAARVAAGLIAFGSYDTPAKAVAWAYVCVDAHAHGGRRRVLPDRGTQLDRPRVALEALPDGLGVRHGRIIAPAAERS